MQKEKVKVSIVQLSTFINRLILSDIYRFMVKCRQIRKYDNALDLVDTIKVNKQASIRYLRSSSMAK